jgi:hypothetical protein
MEPKYTSPSVMDWWDKGGPRSGDLDISFKEMQPGGVNSVCPKSKSKNATFLVLLQIELARYRAMVDLPTFRGPMTKTICTELEELPRPSATIFQFGGKSSGGQSVSVFGMICKFSIPEYFNPPYI